MQIDKSVGVPKIHRTSIVNFAVTRKYVRFFINSMSTQNGKIEQGIYAVKNLIGLLEQN